MLRGRKDGSGLRNLKEKMGEIECEKPIFFFISARAWCNG